MDIRLNKLIRQTNLSLGELVRIINDLGYSCDSNPNCKVPEEVAYLLTGNHNVDLKTLLEREMRIESSVVNSGFNPVLFNESISIAASNLSNELKSGPLYDESKKDFEIKQLIFMCPSSLDTMDVASSECSSESPYYSVLIGPNGVGKSTILREIVEFFIDLHSVAAGNITYNLPKRQGRLCGVKYNIDGAECEVVRLKNRFVAKVNGLTRMLKDLRLPSIVSCHFGAFEKFPTQKVNGSSSTKYDVPYYKYVGAHVNGNLISSHAIMFRLFFTLNGVMDEKHCSSIKSIMDFIGYDHRISMRYSVVEKSKRKGVALDFISQQIQKDNEYANMDSLQKKKLINRVYEFYKEQTLSSSGAHSYTIDLDRSRVETDDRLNIIYKLKQYDLINNVKVAFLKNGHEVSSDEMSSGEFIMLASILSISAATYDTHTLVLLDEPELSQHPNWQMSLIENLDMALRDRTCHVLIATHSHMLVSDLPSRRSCLIHLDKKESGQITSEQISESTYGWSAEEVLLKVFKTATDRNRYFGERVGKLLERMGNNDINPDEVSEELKELQEVSIHLSDADPMKMVLNTIVDTYSKI